MKIETENKIKKALGLIWQLCSTRGATYKKLVNICADEKVDRALYSHLLRIGVLFKDGDLFYWQNEDNLTHDDIIKKVADLQKVAVKEYTKKRKAKKVLVDSITGDKKHLLLKSVSDLLNQVPIENIINHIKSKGFIVLKP